VKSVIPAVKALIAQELVEEHGLKQDDVAEILGISQSAVSKYTRKVRGYVVRVDNIEDMQPLIDSIVILLMGKTCQRAEFLQLFCQACTIIRKTNIMCEFCRKSDPKIEIEECGFCTSLKPRPK